MWYVIDFAPDEAVPLYQIAPTEKKHTIHDQKYANIWQLNLYVSIPKPWTLQHLLL